MTRIPIPERFRSDQRPPIRVRTVALLVIVVCLTSAIGPAVTVGEAADSNVNISSASISPETPTTSEQATIDVEISNLESSSGPVDVTDVYVRTAESAETHERIRNAGSVGPGGSMTVPVPVTFETPGEQTLTVHAVVEDESGDRETYEHPLSVEVAPSTVRADLSVDTTNSSETTVELTNYGTVELTDVDITAAVDSEVVDTAPTHDVDPDSSQTATFDADTLGGEDVTFTAGYEADGSDHETETTQRVDRPIDGEIQLTSVETTQTGSDVAISGDAANVGGTDADSVLVRVPDGDDIEPTSPSGEYFIGPIDGGEFATFELTAALESNVSSIPVEMQYIVDDERVTSTQTVDLDAAGGAVAGVDEPAAAAQAEEPKPDSPGLVSRLPLGLLVGVLAISGIAYYVWNRE